MKTIPLICAAALATVSAQAAITLRFDQNTGDVNTSTDTLAITVDTGANTASSGHTGANNSMTVVEESPTIATTFTLTAQAGYAFDKTLGSETWNADAYASNSELRFDHNTNPRGLAPRGASVRFSPNEILWFEVSGLDSGKTLEWNGYELHGGTDAAKLSVYYGDNTAPDSINLIEVATADRTFVSPFEFKNGDRFGFAHTTGSGSRSGIMALDFDVVAVPEPSSAALIGLGGLALILRRRK